MKIQLNNYKFIDLGSSKGGSLTLGSKLFNGQGLGVEIDPNKIQFLKKGNFDFINTDILELKNKIENKCDYATAIDFFEHLKNKLEFIKIMNILHEFINKYVFIMQPYIENTDLLKKNELNYYWNNWSGHPNLFTKQDFINYFKSQIKYKKIYIGYRKKIKNFNDKVFVPIDTPKNSHEYDEKIHPPKKIYPNLIEGSNEFYKQICVFFLKDKDCESEIISISKNLKINLVENL
jgi:hypothetical protein